jgi:hypothetical protein
VPGWLSAQIDQSVLSLSRAPKTNLNTCRTGPKWQFWASGSMSHPVTTTVKTAKRSTMGFNGEYSMAAFQYILSMEFY